MTSCNPTLVLPVRGVVTTDEATVKSLLTQHQCELARCTFVENGSATSYWVVDRWQGNPEPFHRLVQRECLALRCFLTFCKHHVDTRALDMPDVVQVQGNDYTAMRIPYHHQHSVDPEFSCVSYCAAVTNALRRAGLVYLVVVHHDPDSNVDYYDNTFKIRTDVVFVELSEQQPRQAHQGGAKPVEPNVTGDQQRNNSAANPDNEEPLNAHKEELLNVNKEESLNVKESLNVNKEESPNPDNLNAQDLLRSPTMTTHGPPFPLPEPSHTPTNPQRKPAKMDPTKRTGWGSKRARNNNRSTILSDFLEAHLGPEFLRSGSGILDVAGGKGDFAFKMSVYGDYPTTIVDPRPFEIVRMLKLLSSKQVVRFRHRSLRGNVHTTGQGNPHATGRVVQFTLPLPSHIRCYFEYPNVCLDEPRQRQATGMGNAYVNEKNYNDPAQFALLQEHVKSCSVLVGMHPDQATEAIVDCAMHVGKPFAVVPCCVFPNLFQERTKLGVRSHEQLCAYLLAKDPVKVRRNELDFPGRNAVIWANPTDGKSQ